VFKSKKKPADASASSTKEKAEDKVEEVKSNGVEANGSAQTEEPAAAETKVAEETPAEAEKPAEEATPAPVETAAG